MNEEGKKKKEEERMKEQTQSDLIRTSDTLLTSPLSTHTHHTNFNVTATQNWIFVHTTVARVSFSPCFISFVDRRVPFSLSLSLSLSLQSAAQALMPAARSLNRIISSCLTTSFAAGFRCRIRSSNQYSPLIPSTSSLRLR